MSPFFPTSRVNGNELELNKSENSAYLFVL